jgi:selenide,water dikinase
LLVGFDTSDDAGVYRINDEQAIVVTADFITPPVDDPFRFGQVAAANALSDVYAMGGRPLTCLSLAGFPADKLGPEVLKGIVEGALDKIREAGAVLAGGHTTEDLEPKFGLAVTGIVHPDKIWRNSGARPGDRLILTKPLGSGVLFNANLKGWVSESALAACLDWISTLNRVPAEIAADFPIHGATDVTGFGLGGHGMEMARGAGVTLELEMDAIPVMDEALEVYRRGMTTGMNSGNWDLVGNDLHFAREFPDWRREIIIDPQTNGGLLLSVSGDRAEDLLHALRGGGVASARIVGTVRERGTHGVVVR